MIHCQRLRSFLTLYLLALGPATRQENPVDDDGMSRARVTVAFISAYSSRGDSGGIQSVRGYLWTSGGPSRMPRDTANLYTLK